MSRKRRQYSPEFKAKLTIAALRSDKTAAELASQYEIHPAMLNTWKRELLENASELLENASELFDKGKSASKAQSGIKAENDELYRQIGKLKVERDRANAYSPIFSIRAIKTVLIEKIRAAF